MRVVVIVLLALNLLYLAWTGWIDAPAPQPGVRPAQSLPELQLIAESPVLPVGGASPPSAALGAGGTTALTGLAGTAASCVSVGPFEGLPAVARAAALLREKGFMPRQRAEQGIPWEGFWVFVGGLESAAAEAQVLKTLANAGIRDAHAMPPAGRDRRVSVGLFSERGRAEKRAAAVKRLGLSAQITERRQAQSVYWVDIDVDGPVTLDGLLSAQNDSSRLELRRCPASATDDPAGLAEPRATRPATTTADAGTQRPG